MPLDISKIQAICFDVDGTLSDTDDVYTQSVEKRLPKWLFTDPAYVARRFVMLMEAPGNALLGLADTLHLDDEMVAVIHWLNRRRKPKLKTYLLVPGVEDMLKRLKGKYPLAVISARDEIGVMAFLDHFNLAPYFDVIVTGLSAKYTKPYPDPVYFAAQKMNVAPQNCLMVGDTTVDIRAGRSAGAQTIGVLCGFGEESELKKLGADLILESTPMLADLLLK
jgi:HAD superfamily hydrolase (TIGR01549 family)